MGKEPREMELGRGKEKAKMKARGKKKSPNERGRKKRPREEEKKKSKKKEKLLPCTASSTTAVDAATTCHAPRSASAASCPGSQPAYPLSSQNAPAAAPPDETSELAEGSPPA